MPATPPLLVENAVRSFGERKALDQVGMELRPGEFLALLGRNGAGKTTLIRSISGRLRLDAGRISLLGEIVTPGIRSPQLRRLGIVPQHPAVYNNLSARENLWLFGRILEVPSPVLAERISEVLSWTGLTDRADEPVRNFSGGMQRRLNLACGVLHRPDVILLDEPTVGVDPQSRQRIWEMLRQLQSRGVSLLLTTHQLDEAQQLCDRIVIIDEGRTVAAGSFQELLNSSIGSRRKLVFRFADATAVLPDGCTRRDDNSVAVVVNDIARELPHRLQQFHDAGLQIADLSIENPTLQAVFLHFTGHELREE